MNFQFHFIYGTSGHDWKITIMYPTVTDASASLEPFWCFTKVETLSVGCRDELRPLPTADESRV